MDLVTYAVLNKKIDAIGNIPDEKITAAVNTYLDENPPVTGATAEQAAQIDKNVADIGELKGDLVDLENKIIVKPTDYGISGGYSVSKIFGNANLSSNYDDRTNILTITKDAEVNVNCKVSIPSLTNQGKYTVHFSVTDGNVHDNKVYLYFGDKSQVTKSLANNTIDFSFTYNGNGIVGIAFVIPYSINTISITINSTLYGDRDKIICDDLSNRVANLESTKADKTEIKKITPTLANLAMFTKIATCGDSFTVGQVYVNNVFVGDFPQKSWGASMGRLIGADVSVYASGGANTDTWQTRSSCLPKLLQDEPHELYILALGINDYNGGHAGETRIETGTIADIHDDYTQNPNTFYGNYGKIIAQIKQHAPYAKILLCKSLNPENTGQYNYSSTACEEIAEHFGIAFVETINSVYMNSDFWIKHRDNHPTVIQYAGLGKEMLKLCEETIEKNIAYFMDFYPR